MAANRVCLEHVQQLPRASPDQLKARMVPEQFYSPAHDGDWIEASVCNPASEYRDVPVLRPLHGLYHRLDLRECHKGRDIEAQAVFGEAPDQRGGRLTSAVRDRNLDVD